MLEYLVGFKGDKAVIGTEIKFAASSGVKISFLAKTGLFRKLDCSEVLIKAGVCSRIKIGVVILG